MTGNLSKRENSTEKNRKYIPGILTYGSLQPVIYAGGQRVDRTLRNQAREKDPRARNRRQPEIAYQWNKEENSFWMRLYTSIDASSLVTRAQRTGKAKIRLTVRDAKSKQVVEFISGFVEIARDARDWQNQLKDLMDRAYLFISRNRPQCPLCREQMEIRTGSRGQFWGCSKFPECRGTRNTPEASNGEAKLEKFHNAEKPLKSENKQIGTHPASSGQNAARTS